MPAKRNGDASSGEKLLALYSLLLFRQREFSLTKLAERLRCFRQTVLRLLDQLEAGSYRGPIHELRGGRAYCHLPRPPKRALTLISPEALERLVLCREFVRHLLPDGAKPLRDDSLQRSAALRADA